MKSMLPAAMKLIGDVRGTGDLELHGELDGEIAISGALVIAASGSVRGDLRARSLTLAGSLVGDACAEEWIRIEATGRMVGDLRAPRIQTVHGAKVRGHVEMGAVPPAVAAVPPAAAPNATPEEPVVAQAAPMSEPLPEVAPLPVTRRPSPPRKPPAPVIPVLGRTRAHRREVEGSDARGAFGRG